jgi:hypothetical protein
MKKVEKGKKKIYFIVAFVLILILASGVFAQSLGLSGKAKEAVDQIVENQGIDKNDVKSVEKVDFDKLPEQVDLKNIDTTNLVVYEVDYGGETPVFVITASDESLEAPVSDSTMYKMLLNFGSKGEVSESSFLNSATGVEGSLEKGYVMMRDGSITGLSTSLEVFSGEGSVETIIYINGEPAGFRNTIVGDSVGVKKDYDTQSLGVVKFEKGDVISAYVKTEGNIVVKDVINLVEIFTE